MILYARTLLKGTSDDSLPIMGWVHTQLLTNGFLFAFLLSLGRQYFGNAIECHRDKQSLSDAYLHTSCYMNGTFTMTEDGDRLYYTYYQWMPVILLVEAFGLCWPRIVWRQWIHILPTLNKDNAETILQAIDRHGGQRVFWKMLALEGLCALNFVVQVALLDCLLNGGLWKGLSYDVLFPASAQCDVTYYSGGDMTTGKFICLLPLNIFYRVFFQIGYWIFWTVLATHVLALVYRLLWFYITQDVHRRWLYRLLESRAQGEAFWHWKEAWLKLKKNAVV